MEEEILDIFMLLEKHNSRQETIMISEVRVVITNAEGKELLLLCISADQAA